MAIRAEDRFFGEGVGVYGEKDPHKAFYEHRQHVRVQRLNDLLGKGKELDCSTISRSFSEIRAAIEAADAQVQADNIDFITEHGIKLD